MLEHAPVRALAQDPRLRAIAGANAFAVRAILFDKDPGANWALGWHQDSSIAVRERLEVEGFGPWTVKDGVPHTIAPASLLSEMISLRVHLDACGAETGPLRVIADSHRHGRLTDAQVRELSASQPAVVCLAGAGDVLAFRPLLLHASSSSASVARRRVLQLEYARSELPGGLAWRWRC
ncbi:MAG: phytanoyl-CoA dioxygenase family protein [Archangium sp.]